MKRPTEFALQFGVPLNATDAAGNSRRPLLIELKDARSGMHAPQAESERGKPIERRSP